MKNKGYAKFEGGVQVHYGKCESGVCFLGISQLTLRY